MEWLLAAAAGCRCPQLWLLLVSVLYSRYFMLKRKEKFASLLLSPLYAALNVDIRSSVLANGG